MMLTNITFPLYALRNFERIWEEDKITYVETVYGKYTLDNKNLEGKTLGSRRLRITDNLYTLGGIAFTLRQMLKLSKKYKYFIDNKGIYFKYTKTLWTRVIYKKIVSYTHIEDKGYIILLEGMTTPFIIENIGDAKYAGIINTGKYGYLLYDLSQEYSNPIRVKI